jgi:inosine/xanthosine triphosphate pyrophosphatase family protein
MIADLFGTVFHTAADGTSLEIVREQPAPSSSFSLLDDIRLRAIRDDQCICSLRATFTPYDRQVHPFSAFRIQAVEMQPAGSSTSDRQPIAELIAAYFIEEVFRRLPWVLTVTIDDQAGLEAPETLGFKRAQRISSEAVLYELSREDFNWQNRSQPIFRRFSLPPVWRWPAPLPLTNPVAAAAGVAAPRLHFRTGSHEKRDQYRYLFRCIGVDMAAARLNVSLPEPQVEGSGVDAEAALVHAPLKLFNFHKDSKYDAFPVAVEDTMLFIEHFNRDFDRFPYLPGPDTKRWWAALGAEGIVEAMRASQRRRARYVCQIGVSRRNGDYIHFRAEVSGSIADSVRRDPASDASFPLTNATFFHSIFVPDGADFTLAELDGTDFTKYDYRRKCVEYVLEAANEIFTESLSEPELF